MIVLVLLFGCAPSPYERAERACDRSAEACEAQLLEDFGVMTDTFSDTGLEAFLTGARRLLTWDLGSWPPEEGNLVRRPFVDMLADEEGDTVEARVYNYAATVIVLTQEDPSIAGTTMSFFEGGGVKTYAEFLQPTPYATTLFHEASHATTPGHVTCADGMNCDLDFDGAYGMELAVAALAIDDCLDDLDCEATQNEIDVSWRRIWVDGERPDPLP